MFIWMCTEAGSSNQRDDVENTGNEEWKRSIRHLQMKMLRKLLKEISSLQPQLFPVYPAPGTGSMAAITTAILPSATIQHDPASKQSLISTKGELPVFEGKSLSISYIRHD
ncbi:hypothetical protein J4Q44_G00328430 [Coregonus suidteri]|uniref:Uncharacterized protein n=1 Tax=Coregonus suidteri TaxID=861788 RepID=A0AAN8KXN1_9TELE